MATHVAAESDPEAARRARRAEYGVKEVQEEKRAVKSRAELDADFRKSLFQHVTMNEPANKFKTWFDAKPAKYQLNLARNLALNQLYHGCAWYSGGGAALAVFSHGTEGRVAVAHPCVRGLKSLTTFAFSAWDPSLLATGGSEGVAKLWCIPQGGLKKDLNDGEEVAVLECAGKISMVAFHPSIPGVLVTASTGFDGSYLEVWDLSDEARPSARFRHKTVLEGITDFAFSPNGKYIAIACKDGNCRLVDVRADVVAQEWKPTLENNRDPCVLFVDDTFLVTVGLGKNSRRSVSLWDTRDMSQPVASQNIPPSNQVLNAHFDVDTQLLYIASIGGSFIYVFHVHVDGPTYFEELDMQKSKTDTTAIAFAPSIMVDRMKVQAAIALKLDQNGVISVSPWTVPRKRLEFFQDDLFPIGTDASVPLMSNADYFAGRFPDGVEPTRKCLCPDGVELLSTAPAEADSDHILRYKAQKAKEAAPKVKGVLGHESAEEVANHFRQVAQNVNPSKNRWDAKQEAGDEIAEDEWD